MLKHKKVLPQSEKYVFKDEKLWWYQRPWLKIAPVPFVYTGISADQKVKIIIEAKEHLKGE